VITHTLALQQIGNFSETMQVAATAAAAGAEMLINAAVVALVAATALPLINMPMVTANPLT
jgi:hypothetical protein